MAHEETSQVLDNVGGGNYDDLACLASERHEGSFFAGVTTIFVRAS